MDKPSRNPLEEEDDGQRVLSVRSRFKANGDEHLLLQYGKHGHINSLGDFAAVIRTQRQTEMLAVVEEAMEEGMEWITGQAIAREVGCSQRNVRAVLARVARDGGRYNGRTLIASPHNGYRLA